MLLGLSWWLCGVVGLFGYTKTDFLDEMSFTFDP
jgi:hypothetical protein